MLSSLTLYFPGTHDDDEARATKLLQSSGAISATSLNKYWLGRVIGARIFPFLRQRYCRENERKSHPRRFRYCGVRRYITSRLQEWMRQPLLHLEGTLQGFRVNSRSKLTSCSPEHEGMPDNVGQISHTDAHNCYVGVLQIAEVQLCT